MGPARWANVFHGFSTYTTDPDIAAVSLVAQTVATAYYSNLKAGMHSDCLIEQLRFVQILGPESALETIVPIAVFGTAAGSSSSAQVAACVSCHTGADHYRGGHSRIYLPGVPSGQLASEIAFLTTYVSATLTRMNSFLSAANAASSGAITAFSLGTYRFFRAKVQLDPPEFHAWTSFAMDTRIDTQRRRLGRA